MIKEPNGCVSLTQICGEKARDNFLEMCVNVKTKSQMRDNQGI